MSANIYAPPEEIKIPEIDFTDYPKYQKECEEYIEKLREYCLEGNSGKYTGEVINIPHADGHASYMVASLKPLDLCHIPTGDAYHSQFAELLTVKKVKEMIDGNRRLKKIFSNNK